MRQFSALLVLFAVLGIAGVNPSRAVAGESISVLVGSYAIVERGELKEFVRLEHKDGAYFMSFKESGRWGKPVKLTPVDKAGLEKLINEPVSVTFVGLGNDMVAIFKMPAGWKTRKFETKTGYWLATIFGPVELHRR